jgi:DNA-binding MarR family transcriptional regulator
MRITEQPSMDLLAAATAIRRGATNFATRARVHRLGALTPNQTAVLGFLVKVGAMTPGEIAHLMRVRPQALTRTFAALERLELVYRVSDPADGRQALLNITDAGLQAMRAEMRPRDEWVAELIAAELTPIEQQLLVVAAGVLERLAEVGIAQARGGS